jgi:hypothetical protein
MGPELANPVLVRRFLSSVLRQKLSRRATIKPVSAAVSAVEHLPRVRSAFTQEDVKLVASATRRRYSSFLWKRGDMLIADNVKIAHAGMPGLGKRELTALLCNPIALDYSQSASGLHELSDNDIQHSLGEQLLILKNAAGRPSATMAIPNRA